MAGVMGTALMLAECSRVGLRIDLGALPHPSGHGHEDTPAAFLRWLTSFPSYGYLLSVAPEHVAAVQARFISRGLACAPIGTVQEGSGVWLQRGSLQGALLGDAPAHAPQDLALLWDWQREPFIAGERSGESSGANA